MQLEVRVIRRDFAPKRIRVIHLSGMTELVYQYVVDQLVRQLHQRDVQAYRACATAASPPAAAVAEANFFI